jgi:hypothetical protein
MKLSFYSAKDYDNKSDLFTMEKQSQTKPILSAYVAGKIALSTAEGPLEKHLSASAGKIALNREYNNLQGVGGDIDDFLDELGVTLLIFCYFCEDVFNLLLFHIGRVNNLDVEVPRGQLEVSHHFKLADDFLFISIANPSHIVQ